MIPHGDASGDSRRSTTSGNAARFLGWVAAVLVVISGVAFIALNRAPRGGDESQYARATLELFSLLDSPAGFLHGLIHVFRGKPCGLVWFSVPFVALDKILPVDAALQVAVIVVQLLTVLLVYCAVRSLDRRSELAAFAAALAVAGAPMFVSLGQHFLVEPLQALSAAWFLLILARSRAWSTSFVLAQLLAATAFALSAKQTQPVFCIWPGAVALLFAFRRAGTAAPLTARWKTIATLVFGVPLFAATTVWYVVNRAYVKHHLIGGAFSDVAKTYWGKEAPYPESFAFWTQTFLEVLFLPQTVLVWIAVLACGALVWWRRRAFATSESVVVATVAVQILTVIAAFALSSTRLDRFIVPLVPYAAFLLGAALVALQRRTVSAVVAAVFLLQFVAVQWSALDVTPLRLRGVAKVTRDDTQQRMISSIVASTCSGVPHGTHRINVLAVDPSSPFVGGDWLTAEPANYEVTKQAFSRREPVRCRFDYPSGDFFGAPVEETWQHLVDNHVQFVVVADPRVYPPGSLPFNKVFRPEHLQPFLDRLRNEGRYGLRPSLDDAPGLLVFERVR